MTKEEHRAPTASDGAKTTHDDKDGSAPCQLVRWCDNGNLRQAHSRECLRRQALKYAEAGTQRHYGMTFVAATEREIATRTAVPGQVVLQSVRRIWHGPLNNTLATMPFLITHNWQDSVHQVCPDGAFISDLSTSSSQRRVA